MDYLKGLVEQSRPIWITFAIIILNGLKLPSNFYVQCINQIWGGFHKSWAQGIKRKAHPSLGKNAISWA
jgi:hypothetical protein